MLPFESAIWETARFQPGKWDVWESDGPEAECQLQVKAGTNDTRIPVTLALVKFTSDLRIAGAPGGWEDETARANASIMADGPRLLRALACLVDAVHAEACGLHGHNELMSHALHQAVKMLADHSDNEHAAEWWIRAATSTPAEREHLVEQFINREGT